MARRGTSQSKETNLTLADREDRERRRQLEEILQNIKQEKDDSPLPTPSNLAEFERMNLNHNRRTENAIGNYLTLRFPFSLCLLN